MATPRVFHLKVPVGTGKTRKGARWNPTLPDTDYDVKVETPHNSTFTVESKTATGCMIVLGTAPAGDIDMWVRIGWPSAAFA